MRTVDEAYRRSLSFAEQLNPELAQLAYYFLDSAWQVGVPLAITSGLRNAAEQSELVRTGRSRTMRSAHIRGLAFDVDVLGIGRDQVPAWWWQELGAVGKSFGLVWGGDWSTFRDVGHFEHPSFAQQIAMEDYAVAVTPAEGWHVYNLP